MLFRPSHRQPDFRNLQAVLEGKIPARPTLFEFFLNHRLYGKLAGPDAPPERIETLVRAFDAAGYDYATVHPTHYFFAEDHRDRKETLSLNGESILTSRERFDAFRWKDPDKDSIAEYESIPEYLPEGMKIIPYGPGGVLENVIQLTGYENLCMMIYDDEQLVYDIFEKVGTILVRFYQRAVGYDFVGAMISNDDWGFNTQTMLAPEDMRRFVFPWHKKIVAVAHEAGLPAILHSCGNYDAILDDVILDMKYDARHSYEDNIVPVETAYDQLKGRIAVLGGIDVDFMVSRSPEEIFARAKAMIEKGMEGGGYALGTGNSVPAYIPDDHYFAMIQAAFSKELS